MAITLAVVEATNFTYVPTGRFIFFLSAKRGFAPQRIRDVLPVVSGNLHIWLQVAKS
jgi:hypothetical protein|tara:strand:+ start:14893 stop:15063 length:171 start_codon:yes stop_codon:yes gene_type:complete